jgi:ATP-dependent Lon protease
MSTYGEEDEKDEKDTEATDADEKWAPDLISEEEFYAAHAGTNLMLRDGLARLDLDLEPTAKDVARAHAALAMHWRCAADHIKHFTLRSLRSSVAKGRPAHTVHFVDECRWPELCVESDAQTILVDLIWRIGGDKALARMVRASPFLASKAPEIVQDATQKNMEKVMRDMKLTFSWGMCDHLFGFLAKESLKCRLDPEEDDDPDFVHLHRPFHHTGVDVLDIDDELEGCNIPDSDPAAAKSPAVDTLKRPPLGPLQHQLYSLSDVKRAQKRVSESGGAEHSRRIGNLYERMLEVGGIRPLAQAPAVDAILALAEAFPNFAPVVVDYIAEQISLSRLHNGPAHFSPILLGGPPGIGKTQFCVDLAKVLGTTFATVPFSNTTAGWILSGSSPLWNGSKAGRIFETLYGGGHEQGHGNPLLMLDELDKVGGDQRYDPLGPLYQLLEPATAKAFVDEYVDLQIDASLIMYAATANDLDRIPEPILSRFTVFNVAAPTTDQVRMIAARIYEQMLQEPFGSFFDSTLPDAVLDALGSRSPRELRLVLRRALGKAAMADRRTIKVFDLVHESAVQPRRSIGFCA